MKIAITTIGTTGDIAPFLLLTEALIARDHQVVICSHERYRPKCEARGASFVPVGPVMSDDAIQRIGQLTAQAKDIFAQLTILRDFFLEDAEADYHSLKDAFADVDLVICHAIHNIAQAAAEDTGKTWLRVQLEPSSIPTAYAAPEPLPSMGKGINRWLWKQVELQLRKLDQPLQQRLKALGSESSADRLFRSESPHANLVACSRHIAAFYSDLPDRYEVTGAWLAAPDESYKPPDALAAFLARHPAPLVFSFGSMAGEDAARTDGILREAIARLGRPAIIQHGAAGLGESHDKSPSEDILYWGFAPHTYLFPRASCAIHHGGAGTLATACAAGTPSVIIPHMGDQFYWGQRVYRSGIGPKGLPLQKLNAKRLASRIKEALKPACTASATQLARRMAEEDGVTAAVAAIESYAA